MSSLRVTVASASDVGRKRSQNEDAYAVWIPDQPEARARQGILLVLSDGMGGSQAGEVASRLTVETVMSWFRASVAEPREGLRAAVEEANRVVHERSRAESKWSGMGATCTALAVRGREAWIAHVGDSRAYLVRNGSIRQLTEDHSLVAQLVQQRQITPEEARLDPRRNVVTRSVGVAEHVAVDAHQLDGELQAEDTLLLCSDGLHGLVSDDELADLGGGHDLGSASNELVALANQRGGPDNITVILARLEADPVDGGPPSSGR